jgi:two-component system, cell cycle sensor histidine kinase and response regulator CckA
MLLTARSANAFVSETHRPAGPRAGATPAANDASPGARPVRTILLVEDDPVVRHVVRLLLELGGDVVLEAKDGDEALTLSGSHEGTIDLLLTDVMMPGLSGADVCRRVRESRPGIPTLFISGFYPEAVFPDHRLPEAAAFLAKPFMPEELTEAVDDLLSGLAGHEDGRPVARRAARRRL